MSKKTSTANAAADLRGSLVHALKLCPPRPDSGTLFPNVIAPQDKHLLNAAVPTSRARESHRTLIIVLTVLAAGLLWFVNDKIHYLTHYSLASYTDYYWPRRAGLLPHLLGGSLAIVAGLVQIWLGLMWPGS
jgi:hypothetical protein